jgi:hypothetical protein
MSPPEQHSPQSEFQKLRERTTSALALVVLLGFGAAIVRAFSYIETTDEAYFTRVKDLLAILTPLVGVVIGYYFNKASTEARAETAEKTAKSAQETAQSAQSAAQEATAARAQAEEVAVAASRSVDELTAAAQQLMAGSDMPSFGVDAGSPGAGLSPQDQMRVAIENARARRRL